MDLETFFEADVPVVPTMLELLDVDPAFDWVAQIVADPPLTLLPLQDVPR